MEFNFLEFLNKSKRTCRSKSDSIESIKKEVEAVSKINDERTYMDRLKYLHQLEMVKLVLKSEVLLKEGKYNVELMDLLEGLGDQSDATVL
jgi:hypothetical protein